MANELLKTIDFGDGIKRAVAPEWENIQNKPENLATKEFVTEAVVNADWNQNDETAKDYIKNKPFGEIVTRGDTISWDGNIEGRTCVLQDIPDDSLKAGWCFMSDYVLTPDDFTEGFKDTYFFMGSEEIGVIANQEDMEHHFLNDGVFWTGSGRTIGVPYDNYEYEGTIYPNKGIYFNFVIYNGELLEYGSSLTIPGFDFADTTIKKIDEKYIPDSIARKSDLENVGTQPNWNQNDETAKDYIKNRTHWVSEEIVDYIKEEQYRFSDTGFVGVWTKEKRRFIEGITYTVIFNGVEYICTPWSKDNILFALGNEACIPGKVSMENPAGNNEPFCIYVNNDDDFNCPYVSLKSYMSRFDLQVSGIGTVVHPIDEKYLTAVAGRNVAGKTFEVNGENLVAKEGAEVFNGGNIAIGSDSHAEGAGTLALGYISHAEGQWTETLGSISHAEGRASIASGYVSHAEGQSSEANGDYSHAEGFYTKASGEYQHVQGTYNIEDTEDIYAHIVGNGDWETRSNAHTLDWNGNAWFSGDIYVGSTSGINKDGGSKKLATENYVTENYYTKAEVEALIAQAITAAIAASY